MELFVKVLAAPFMVVVGVCFGLLIGRLWKTQDLFPDNKAEKQPLPPAILADALQDRGFVRPGASRAAVSVKVSPRWPPVPRTEAERAERARLIAAATAGRR